MSNEQERGWLVQVHAQVIEAETAQGAAVEFVRRLLNHNVVLINGSYHTVRPDQVVEPEWKPRVKL